MAESIPYVLELSLPIVPTPLNIMLRMHHHKRSRVSDTYKLIIKQQLRGLQRPLWPLETCKITIVRHFYRFLDFDNCVASYKNIIDLIVRENIIVDDGWKITGQWDVSQEFRPKDEGPLSYVKIEGNQKTKSGPYQEILETTESEEGYENRGRKNRGIDGVDKKRG